MSYDEPKILSSQLSQFCLMGADVGQARRTIAGFEAMLWLRKGFSFSGGWTVNDQNDFLARLFGLQKINKA